MAAARPREVVVLPRFCPVRSEEHTSELQSQSNLVCRLLLDPASTDFYTLSLHDALPIFVHRIGQVENRLHEHGVLIGPGAVDQDVALTDRLEEAEAVTARHDGGRQAEGGCRLAAVLPSQIGRAHV